MTKLIRPVANSQGRNHFPDGFQRSGQERNFSQQKYRFARINPADTMTCESGGPRLMTLFDEQTTKDPLFFFIRIQIPLFCGRTKHSPLRSQQRAISTADFHCGFPTPAEQRRWNFDCWIMSDKNEKNTNAFDGSKRIRHKPQRIVERTPNWTSKLDLKTGPQDWTSKLDLKTARHQRGRRTHSDVKKTRRGDPFPREERGINIMKVHI